MLDERSFVLLLLAFFSFRVVVNYCIFSLAMSAPQTSFGCFVKGSIYIGLLSTLLPRQKLLFRITFLDGVGFCAPLEFLCFNPL